MACEELLSDRQGGTKTPISPPVLLSALLGGLFLGLFAQGCASNGGAGPEKGGSGGKTESSGTGSAGSGGAGSGGESSAGTGSGGIGSGGASSSRSSAAGGVGPGGAGSGGAGSGGAGRSGSSTGSAGSGGAATSSVGSEGTGKGGSGTGMAATGGTGTASSVASGGAGRSGSGPGGTGSGGTGTTGATGNGGTSGAGSAGAGDAGAGGALAFNPCPTTGAACNIMPLGDSITDGVGSSQGGGYRVELFHKAVQAHKAITFVGSATDPNGPATVDGKTFPRNHEGHPGYTVDNSSTTSGISPLVDASISTNHPNIITLMIGTNDLNRNVDPTNFPTRLGTLLDKIIKAAPNALVVVAKITPWQDDGTNASAVEPFNTKIATLVQTYIASGKHVALVDMYTPFRANTNYKTALLGDYLHPNDAGYVIMGDVWYNAIQSYLPAAP